MNKQFLFSLSLMGAASLFLTSCFKEEPLNAECDIEQAYIHSDTPSELFENVSDTLVNVQSDETSITFTLRSGVDVSRLAPLFRLTEGATISPANGSVQDFSKGSVTYTVTSEDGKWSRTYTVSVKSQTVLSDEIHFDFEDAELTGKFYSWYETLTGSDGQAVRERIWASGNAGYQISNPSTQPEDYPTTVDNDSYDGKGVKLQTCRTSALADMVKKPIAAGNLFIGNFNAQSALQDAMKATKFGRAFSFGSKPVEFCGYYRYQRGAVCTDRNMQEVDMEDTGTLYAVLYDNHDADGNAVVLYGDNVQTSDQVVALALLPDVSNTSGWTPFSVSFDYRKEVDLQKLKQGGYSLAVVCSSSAKGGDFIGAVGSTLWVDKLSILCENSKNK